MPTEKGFTLSEKEISKTFNTSPLETSLKLKVMSRRM